MRIYLVTYPLQEVHVVDMKHLYIHLQYSLNLPITLHVTYSTYTLPISDRWRSSSVVFSWCSSLSYWLSSAPGRVTRYSTLSLSFTLLFVSLQLNDMLRQNPSTFLTLNMTLWTGETSIVVMEPVMYSSRHGMLL